MEMKHKSVMMNEVLDGLNVLPGGTYIDATLGGAGHSLEIARRLGDGGLLVGVDQDEFAIGRAHEVLAGYADRVRIVHANFSDVAIVGEIAAQGRNDNQVDGVLMDLGVSSFQLDDGSRGFSYMQDAPLDMRMDRGADFSAYDVINGYGEDELRKIFLLYGEEKWSARIAEFVVAARANKPIRTSFELVGIIKAAVPKGARRDGPHPAKRVFQAIRIEVNNELGILEQAIEDYVDILAPNGRICIISFHSLEDKIAKNTFARLKSPCICPREFPVCTCGKLPKVEIVTKRPIVPSEDEVAKNPRARSAKLRVAEKTPHQVRGDTGRHL